MTMKEIIRQTLENVLPLVDLDSDFLFQELDSLGITTISISEFLSITLAIDFSIKCTTHFSNLII